MSRAWLLACAFAMAGCVRDELVICGELACPAGYVCTAGGCATPEAAAQCDGKADLDPCGTDGACAGGACHPIACGDGFDELVEACDDGNVASGDGCSADCRSDESCGNQIVDAVRGEQCDIGPRGLSGDGCSSRCTNEVALWLAPGGGFGPLFNHPAVAYRRGKTVAFGGVDASNDPLDTTWEWDGTSWVLRHPIRSPSARSLVTMTYDEARDRVVLFGGRSPTNLNLADTWEWDGATWIERTPAIVPPARSEAMLAYDSDRKVVVMFGGFGPGGTLGDTWEWDGTTWTQRTPAVSPSARARAGFAYDRVRRRTVMAGGGFGTTGTWEWDGTTWANVAPEPSTFLSQMVFEEVTGRCVLVTAEPSQWEWNGTWTRRTVTPPNFIVRRSMVYDQQRAKIVIVGAPFADGELWEWDQVTWAEPLVYAGPSTSSVHTYDARRGRVVALDVFSGTWEWDGEGWVRAATSAESPLLDTVIAADTARGLVIAYGFNYVTSAPATLTWNGKAWTPVTGAMPSEREGAAMAFDSARGRVVLFGGTDAGVPFEDTWELDGTGWTMRTPATRPPGRTKHAMAYDPMRQRIVMFGGNRVMPIGVLGDTWEWDGTNWTERMPALSPIARERHAMAYDPLRHRIALTGRRGDLWEWDGTTWAQRALVIPTPQDGSLAPDITGGLLLANTPLRLESRSETVPREQCTVTEDFDGDELRGCADPDCWTRCTPLCPPGLTCDPSWPRCGDGTCSPVETPALCPGDCP